MMKIKCSGAVGDAYIILCKIYGKDVNCIEHYTAHRHLHPTLKKLYELLDIKSVEFTSQNNFDVSIKGYITEGDTYTPNPKFPLPDISKYKLPNDYSVVQVKSGEVGNQKWRVLSSADLSEVKGNIVLVGTDSVEVHLPNAIDIRNKTTLAEVFSIIQKSKQFYGPQGLLSFFALSQQVKSTVYLKAASDKHAVSHRIDKIPEWSKLVTYK